MDRDACANLWRAVRQCVRFCTVGVLLLALAACGDDGAADADPGRIAWEETIAPPPAPASPTAPPAVDTGVGGAGEVPITLGADDLAIHQPNELGRIPILMYHAFTNDEADLDEWTVTPGTFRQHLEWLYEHDFYIVPLVDLINNEISAPPGKHPVVITFDDASSRQFRLIHDDAGQLVPDPETAVGVMESFFAAHPNFGRGGVFAVVPTNCFHYATEIVTCEDRIEWLADHGYEIANHTWWHENLHTVTDELFREQVGKTKIWIDERVSGRSNLSNVLFLPFGEWPRSESQVAMLTGSFVYGGQDIVITGVVEVGGGPSPSPSSGEWTRRSIARMNTDPETWELWTGRIEAGDITLFTSDGNPATVTIPEDLPEDLVPHWDPDWASAYGMQVIRYDASS
jgi:peptidoglycan/xylan/chitin deacetylase (PgdA/CDA1 family)